MKKITLSLLLSCSLTGAFAQGTGSFFNQQSSKIKLMLAQIAGYAAFLHNLENGYRITQNGLNTVHEMKGGTYSLHTAYFSSLEQVSPAVQANPKGKAMAGMAQQINTAFSNELGWEQQQKILSAAELNYIGQVYQSLMKKCRQDMSDLAQVLNPGKLQMTDAQRLSRIDKLYASMQDKLAFAQSFTGKCRQLANDRKRAQKNNAQLKALYGIH